MSNEPRLRPSVQQARERLSAERIKIRRQHEEGSSGIHVCAHLADLLDTVVLDIFEAALVDLGEEGAEGLRKIIALVPHGGFGRRDVAPYSDVDLMLLHRGRANDRIAALAKRLVIDIGDAGLSLGFSVRSVGHACNLAFSDVEILTSLSEARYLAGSVSLYSRFARRLSNGARRRYRNLYEAIVESRRTERRRFGQTVYLLEPNIKRSRGGLRDIQLLRWVGFARHGETDLDALYLAGVLSRDDRRTLREAGEFLLRIRNEMHFCAQGAQDRLDRAEQVRLAEKLGYEDGEGLLPVERFMSDYFHHTSAVQDVVAHYLASERPGKWMVRVLGPLFSHHIDGDYRVGPKHIEATSRGLAKLQGNLVEVLRLMDLANRYDKWIEHGTWEAIRDSMNAAETPELTEECTQRFLSLLSQPTRLGGLLRRLHELRVLEAIVPGMSHARCLLQFNQYHRYTVDEHCIRTVEAATDFQTRDDTLGRAYRKVTQKHILHLAALLHDLGKGQVEDHSDVGLRLARETAQRLRLSPEETETLCFLVHKHLFMSHQAFQKAGTEEEVVHFAVEVGSPEQLRMLYVLTCADLAAVGPGVLNEWKVEVLSNLYRHARDYLTGGPPDEEMADRLAKRRQQVLAKAGEGEAAEWIKQRIAELPTAYLFSSPPDHIVSELKLLCDLPRDRAVATARWLKDRKAVEYSVAAYEELTSSIFHRLTGVLTSRGQEILSAEIHTLSDGLVLDRFYVQDTEFSGQPPVSQFEKLCNKLVDAIEKPNADPPVFRRYWPGVGGRVHPELELQPTRVHFDNRSSEQYTIIRVFAHDRRGLLYAVTRAIRHADLSVCMARIGTFLDQVVDVFYVTDQDGGRIESPERQEDVRQQLLEAIRQVDEDQRADVKG